MAKSKSNSDTNNTFRIMKYGRLFEISYQTQTSKKNSSFEITSVDSNRSDCVKLQSFVGRRYDSIDTAKSDILFKINELRNKGYLPDISRMR